MKAPLDAKRPLKIIRSTLFKAPNFAYMRIAQVWP